MFSIGSCEMEGAIELLFEFIKASPDDLTCGNVLLLLLIF